MLMRYVSNHSLNTKTSADTNTSTSTTTTTSSSSGGKMSMCLLGGVDSLTAMRSAMSDGFACVAMARPLLREPDYLLRLQAEIQAEAEAEAEAEMEVEVEVEETGALIGKSRCSHCNQCIVVSAMAELPLHCTEREREMW